MHTKSEITQVYLTHDDVHYLIKEVHQLVIDLNIKGTREFIERYPALKQLQQKLIEERIINENI